MAPWRARRIAAATHGLTPRAAAYVEAKVLAKADSCGPVTLDKLVAEAAAMFDPVVQAEAEAEAKKSWGVRLDDYAGPVWAGTSRLEITGDTPTLRAFNDLLSRSAHDQLDPTRPAAEQPSLEHRKVAALNTLVSSSDSRETGTGVPVKGYVHFEYSDLPDNLAYGRVEKLGPLTIATLKEWFGPGPFTIQPVIRMDRNDSVDQHDPPAWMREQVILRDKECVFPWCHKDARDCDLDHIEAYIAMDDGGPPGQTSPEKLAALCRRHHRAKTFRGWTYLRNTDGTYTWTSKHGRQFSVDTHGIVTRL